MNVLRQGAFVIHKGELVARLNRTVEINGNLMRIPIRERLPERMIRERVSSTTSSSIELCVPDRQIKGLPILELTLYTDLTVSNVLENMPDWFTPPDVDPGPSAAGILSALKIVKGLDEVKGSDMIHVRHLEYLIEKYTSISKDEP